MAGRTVKLQLLAEALQELIDAALDLEPDADWARFRAARNKAARLWRDGLGLDAAVAQHRSAIEAALRLADDKARGTEDAAKRHRRSV